MLRDDVAWTRLWSAILGLMPVVCALPSFRAPFFEGKERGGRGGPFCARRILRRAQFRCLDIDIHVLTFLYFAIKKWVESDAARQR